MENVSFLYAKLKEYQKKPSSFEESVKKELLQETEAFLNDFLTGSVVFETEAAPELLMFLRKATIFDNLKDIIKLARKKLQKDLNDFDKRYGLIGLENIPEELIEKNIDKIGILSQMSPKERPEFRKLFDIISRIDLTDENGRSLGKDGNKKIETIVVDLGRTDAFFCLLGETDLNIDKYFSVLLDAMQVNLIGLFYAEEIAHLYPLNEETKEKVISYMGKLINQIK